MLIVIEKYLKNCQLEKPYKNKKPIASTSNRLFDSISLTYVKKYIIIT